MRPVESYDLVIIGAGAAGLWGAIQAAGAAAGAARSPLRIAILDRRDKVGAKILMSGGTRCNLTHREVVAEDFRGGNRNRIARVLRAHPAEESKRVFTEVLGVAIKEEPGGKIFPADDKATTVRTALLFALERLGVPLLRGRRWCGLVADPESGRSWRVLLCDEAGRPLPAIEAARVLVATGGCSYPESGSDGSGYALLRELGHHVVEPLPALTPLRLSGGLHTELTGIATPVRLELWVDGKIESSAESPMLWTHTGVSGPAALDISGPWARARRERPDAGIEVRASFLPGESFDVLEKRWLDEGTRFPSRTVRALVSALPHRLADSLIRTAGGDPARPLAQTPRPERRAVIEGLLRFPVPVVGVIGFHKAEVTSGGVPLEEVDQGLESRLLPGVHLAGEVLHVDGRLGGFNFQWAWSSATVAAQAAVDRLLKTGAGPGAAGDER